jgi:hypothetical protein
MEIKMNIRTFNKIIVLAISLTVSMFALAVDSADDAAAAAAAIPEGPATPKTPPASQPPASAPGGGATAPPVSNVCILGCVTLLGSNAKISITEIQKAHGVDYEVTLLDDALTVTAFGVTNIENDDYDTINENRFWESEYLSENAWNAGFEFTYLTNQVLTSALGLFDDLFGLEEDHVAFFYRTNSLTAIKGEGALDFKNTASGFSLSLAVPLSEFAAFSGNNLVSQSSVNDVPEPSTLAIFALGLMGLASRRFNKKS